MNIEDAINFIIEGDYEGYALKKLSISIRNKLANEYAKNAELSSRIKDIEEINNTIHNPYKRKNSIANLCKDEIKIDI